MSWHVFSKHNSVTRQQHHGDSDDHDPLTQPRSVPSNH